MHVYALALSTGVSFVFLALVFRPLEMVFPAKPGQRFFRPAWWTDLCFLLGQYLFWNGLVLWVLAQFGHWLDGMVPEGTRQGVAAQPWWLQAVIAVNDVPQDVEDRLGDVVHVHRRRLPTLLLSRGGDVLAERPR
jgi:hypothetical protein